MRCGHLIYNHSFLHKSMHTYAFSLKSLKYWKKKRVFLSNNNKNNRRSLHYPAFFKILKEPTIVQKQTIPHMKALILNFLVPEEQGPGIIMERPRPHPVKCLLPFLSEVEEAKWGWKKIKLIDQVKCPHLMNVLILFLWPKSVFWWPNKHFI